MGQQLSLIRSNYILLSNARNVPPTSPDDDNNFSDFITYPAVTQQEILEIFRDIDKDSDGTLSFDEVSQILTEKLSLPKSYASSAFRECDVERDGHISVGEFEEWVKRKDRDVYIVFHQLSAAFRHQQEVTSAPSTEELNVDGLSMLMQQLHLRGDPKELLHQLDVDHNGSISYAEFRKGFSLICPADFSHLADHWLEYTAHDATGHVHSTVVTPKPKEKVSVAVESGDWRSKVTFSPVVNSAIAGAFGNAFSRTAIAPLERVRMQMIVDPGKYSSMSQVFSTIIKEEGVTGFWRGNSINVMRIAPQGAIAFFCKDYFRNVLSNGVDYKQIPKQKRKPPTPLQVLGASMLSGICCQTGVYPLDIVRTRLTTTPGLYKGLIDGLKTIVQKEGVRALTKGLYPANCFAVPYYGTQFFTYDRLKFYYATYGLEKGETRPIPLWVSLPMGGFANCIACVVAFPLQTAWKRIQTQGIGGRPIKYSGPWDCLYQIVTKEGMRSMYSGLVPNLIKLLPTGALTFWAVENVKHVMNW